VPRKHAVNLRWLACLAVPAETFVEERAFTMGEILTVIRHMKMREVLGLTGRLLGFGLFIGLIYTYCHVLVETCFQGIR
jgi:hypothetical protein